MTGLLLNRARVEVGEAAGEGSVLEVGIGTGASLGQYRAGASITGIDLSPQMLTVAARNARGLGRQVDLLGMDAQALDFPDRTFDAVVFNLCLCTIPDPALAVHEALRVARPGARMIFLEHVRSQIPAVALLQDLINPVTVWLQHDFWNRRTPEIVRRVGVLDVTERRWLLGVFALMVGRAP